MKTLVERTRGGWPPVAAAVILLAAVGLLAGVSLRQNGGHLVYPLDDPYIHMAMAKNLSQHGVWGVTRYGFTSSSSSPLWTLLLSLVYSMAGPNEPALLVLDLIFALLTLVLVDRLMAGRGLGQWSRSCVLCGLVVLVPLPAMVLTGQEHVLHLLVSMLFLWFGAKAVAGPKSRFNWPLVGLGFLLTAVRYEGAFLVAAVVLLLLWRRRTRLGLVLAGAALVPIVAYGIVSVSQGWYFLPNSVLMKASATRNAVHLIRAGLVHPGFWKGLANLAGFWGLKQVATTPHILASVVAVLALLVVRVAKRVGPGPWMLLSVSSSWLWSSCTCSLPSPGRCTGTRRTWSAWAAPLACCCFAAWPKTGQTAGLWSLLR
jgi:hypothetical protein